MISATLKNTHGITMTFAGHASLYLDPKTLTPPGIDGGDAIDTSSHSNSAVRTKYPRTLKEITDAAFTAAYDPDAWDAIYAAIGANVAITITFPGTDFGNTVVYGYLKSFIPNEYVDGADATAECVVVITNDSSGTETIPAHTTAS